jgi:hypothetical protein
VRRKLPTTIDPSPLRVHVRGRARIIRVRAAAEFVAHAVDRGESYTRESRTSTVGGFNGRCRMVAARATTRLMSLRITCSWLNREYVDTLCRRNCLRVVNYLELAASRRRLTFVLRRLGSRGTVDSLSGQSQLSFV